MDGLTKLPENTCRGQPLQITDEPTVAERLHVTGRRTVRLRHRLDQSESFTQFRANPGRIVSAHRQTATTLRTVEREGSHDYCPASFHHVAHVYDVSRPVLGFSEEVKDSAVMPDVHRGNRPRTRHIGFDPSHSVGLFAQPFLCSRQSDR